MPKQLCNSAQTIFSNANVIKPFANYEYEIKRMECLILSYDGNQTVASCVVFNQEGPLKSDYRRFM